MIRAGSVAATAKAPNAQQARASVLSYLQGLNTGTSNRVLIGQMAIKGFKTTSEADQIFQNAWEAIYTQTGKYPALLGGEFGPTADTIKYLRYKVLKNVEAGCLYSLSIYPKNPWTGGSFADRSTIGCYKELITPGNSAYTNWRNYLDLIADELKVLEDHKIVVLFRPLHEITARWAWWMGNNSGVQSVIYDYGTSEWTLNETVTAGSGGTGTVIFWTHTSGSWTAGTAYGTLYMKDVTGSFVDGTSLTGSISGEATQTGAIINNHQKEEVKELWQDMHSYLTTTKGLGNILWMYNAQEELPGVLDVLHYYPGDAYVDLVSMDIYNYTTESEFVSKADAGSAYSALVSTGKPMFIAETGQCTGTCTSPMDLMEVINAIKNSLPDIVGIVWYNSWGDNKISIPDNNNASSLLNDAWSITRDEVGPLS